MSTTVSSILPSTSAAANLDVVTTPVPIQETPSTANNTAPAVCRYYLRGICWFGSYCRFSHGVGGNEAFSYTNDPEMTAISTTVRDKRFHWARAPAFIPGEQKRTTLAIAEANCGISAKRRTWSQVVGSSELNSVGSISSICSAEPASINSLCPLEGPCPYGRNCTFAMHLKQCKMCDQFCLNPTDADQRRKHNQECLKQHEQAMELSFAIARSRDKMCGICMDIIMEKTGSKNRFGILPNCCHVFCLDCIRKWRQSKDFHHKVIRSCPECRISSDFVCPSPFWVDTKEEKDKLFNDYRTALGLKDCKYFKKGDGTCPFGNKCFYKHALANGNLVDVGCPRRARRVRDESDEYITLIDAYLWEFVDHRDYSFEEWFMGTSDYSDETDDSGDE